MKGFAAVSKKNCVLCYREKISFMEILKKIRFQETSYIDFIAFFFFEMENYRLKSLSKISSNELRNNFQKN